MALNYTGSGPGRFFRAWRYQRRRRLNVVNYASVLVGFLTVVTTILMAYFAMAGHFFQYDIVVFHPRGEHEAIAEELIYRLRESRLTSDERFHALTVWIRPWPTSYYYREKLKGFTVRYYRDEPGTGEAARVLFNSTKQSLRDLLVRTTPANGRILRGHLLKAPLSEARSVMGGNAYRPIHYGNYPHFRYEIWLGSDLLIPEGEAIQTPPVAE